MSIRMMPMDYVFSRFPRLVRDIAGKMGKQIELQTYGRATELDKSLIERIIDPLTHLVRNSLDHGIETPEKRVASGKDPVGQLVLSAQHNGGNIVIEVSDDGAGLNREKILKKAMSQGLPVNENSPDDEIWQLIFAPGPADQRPDLFGRRQRARDAGACGEYLPLVEMHRVFSVGGAQTDPTQAIAVIMQAEDRRFALLVDHLIGQHQVVVKNLESNYRKVPGISAATILGDGSVALIVDVFALARANRERWSQPEAILN